MPCSHTAHQLQNQELYPPGRALCASGLVSTRGPETQLLRAGCREPAGAGQRCPGRPVLPPSALSTFLVFRRKFPPGSEQTAPWPLQLGLDLEEGPQPVPPWALLPAHPGRTQTGTLAKSRLALLSWFCLLPTHLPPSLSLEPPTCTAPAAPGPGEALTSGGGWGEKGD